MSHAAALLGLAAAGAAYFLLLRFGGRGWRSWAGPAASAIAWWAIDSAYGPPWWVTLAGFLGVCVLIHRFVRGRQEVEARRVDSVEVSSLKMTLRRVQSGKHVGVWASEPRGLDLTLDFVGAAEDQYEVILWTTAEKGLPGALLVHHYDAPKDVQGLLKAGLVGGLPGLPGWMCVRGEPADCAFDLLDARTLDLLVGILGLRSRGREVYAFFQGRGLHIASTGVFTEGELRRLLALAAELFQRIRQPRPR